MVLNKFADLIEEEYIAATQAPNEVKDEVPEKIEAVEKEETEVVADEPVEESAMIVDESENAAQAEAAKEQVDAAEATKKQAEASRIIVAAGLQFKVVFNRSGKRLIFFCTLERAEFVSVSSVIFIFIFVWCCVCVGCFI